MDDYRYDSGKVQYNLQRYQILQTKLNPATSFLIQNDYAYAWSENLFPLFDSSPLHEDLEGFFSISRLEIEKVLNFADEQWLENKYHTFYDYEDLFDLGEKKGSTRFKLIAIFRYMNLRNTFDNKFWQKLIENAPIEASGLIRKFTNEELYLL